MILAPKGLQNVTEEGLLRFHWGVGGGRLCRSFLFCWEFG